MRHSHWKDGFAGKCIVVVLVFSLLFFVYRHRIGYRLGCQGIGSDLYTGISRHLSKLEDFSNNGDDSIKVNTTIAAQLSAKVRVLCLILTTEANLDVRGRTVKATWAKRCNKYFFVLDTKIKSFNIINSNMTESRDNLIYKMYSAFRYIYDHHINDFDWVLKSDDDTYVIVENLRFLLSFYNGSLPGYLGYHFNRFIPDGYMSGGAGYVISNKGIRNLIEKGLSKEVCGVVPIATEKEISEDVEVGRCLGIAGVPVLSSLDLHGRETFHPYSLDTYMTGELPSYMYLWAMNSPDLGPGCCSQYSVTFHYMRPEVMLLIDHLLYRTSVYGRDNYRHDFVPFQIRPVHATTTTS